MKPRELEQRAAELFKAALDCDPARWAEYLQRECGDDESLRAAVESLLAAHSAATGFLEPHWDQGSWERLRTATAGPRRLGDFEIVREIGRGGMGVVYEAQQVSLKRKVALKVLSGQLGLTSQAVVRFRREAEAAAKLHHTNIVPIYAIGEQDDTHYYAMELIEGPSLNVVIQALRESSAEAGSGSSGATSGLPAWVIETVSGAALAGPKPKPEAPATRPVSPADATGGTDGSSLLRSAGGYFDAIARLIAEVADALDYAHKQGVIHRDIKPSNLLLSSVSPVSNRSPDSSETCPTKLSITDFGLARVLEQPGMTTTGDFLGTPRYMSPEQIAAGRAPLDHRTDIYSLGATLYELLTLQPPFPGEGREQVLAQIIEKDPVPPRRGNRKIPVDLETICLKALEKDPERRYRSAEELARDIGRYLAGEPIEAQRSTAYVLRKYLRKYRLPVAVVVSFVLVAAVGLVGSLTFWRQAARARRYVEERQIAAKVSDAQAVDEAVVPGASLAVLPLVNLSSDPDEENFADGLTGELIDQLSQTAPEKLRVIEHTLTMPYKGQSVAVPEIGRTLNVNYVLQGTVGRVGDTVRINAELIQVLDGRQLWREQYDRAAADLAAVESEIADSVAKALATDLSPDERAKLAQAAMAGLDAHGLYSLGREFWNKPTKASLDTALRYFEQALAKDPNFALAYVGLADTYHELADRGYRPAQETAPKIKELVAKAFAIEPALGEAHFTLGIALHTYDWDFAGAEQEFRRGLELAPGYAVGRYMYTQYLQALGPLDEALAQAEEAVRLEPTSPAFILARGYTYFFRREHDRAIADYLHALELAPDLPIHIELGCIYQNANRPELAAQEAETALRLEGAKPEVLRSYQEAYRSGRKLGADRWLANRWEQLGADPTAIGGMYAILGEVDNAFQWLDRGYEERSSLLLVALNFHPALDPIRSDPRYDELARRMGLPRRGTMPAAP